MLPRVHCFVLDADIKTPASAFATMAPDLQAQLREDVAPAWGVGNGDVVQATTIAAGEGAPVGVVPIRVHRDAPDPDSGALAEHGDLSDGTPEIDVYEALLEQYGISDATPTLADALSSAISHELIEARVDSDCQREATVGGRTVAVEACDQVQEIIYRKGQTAVSNFNTPSNFAIGSSAPPFDFLGKQPGQFQCMPGGYEQWLDPDSGWQMITAQSHLTSKIEDSMRVRAAIDAMPMGMGRYRAELAWRGLGRHAKRKKKHTGK
jgi:hypothetical protein